MAASTHPEIGLWWLARTWRGRCQEQESSSTPQKRTASHWSCHSRSSVAGALHLFGTVASVEPPWTTFYAWRKYEGPTPQHLRSRLHRLGTLITAWIRWLGAICPMWEPFQRPIHHSRSLSRSGSGVWPPPPVEPTAKQRRDAAAENWTFRCPTFCGNLARTVWELPGGTSIESSQHQHDSG